MRGRQGRENHKNDTIESKENTKARARTPLAQHAFIAIIFPLAQHTFIAIIFFISKESISRRRENEKRPKSAWPSLSLSPEVATIG
jgi:hypothetical protein